MKIKYILIIVGFIIIYLVIENFDNIKFEYEREQLKTTGFYGKTVNGLKQGQWINYFKNGRVAEIKTYLNDTLNGERIGYTPSGDTGYIEKYKCGIKVDTYKLFSNGKLNLVEFRDSLGLLQGEFKVFVNNSLSQVGHYLDNKFHGDFITFFPKTEEVKEIYHYDNGEKSGKWIYFNVNGDTIKIENY